MTATALLPGADALRATPVRALLATLGVVIGAAALVAVLAIGDGVERFARDMVSREGCDVVQARPIVDDSVDGVLVARAEVPRLTVADVHALGVREAVGARRRDILLQLLAGSVTITAAGSALGTAIGLGAAYGVTAIRRAQSQAQVYAATTLGTLPVSAGIPVLVGLALGCYPALRAARLAPIEAIHTA